MTRTYSLDDGRVALLENQLIRYKIYTFGVNIKSLELIKIGTHYFDRYRGNRSIKKEFLV